MKKEIIKAIIKNNIPFIPSNIYIFDHDFEIEFGVGYKKTKYSGMKYFKIIHIKGKDFMDSIENLKKQISDWGIK